jgi:hypothetical protein
VQLCVTRILLQADAYGQIYTSNMSRATSQTSTVSAITTNGLARSLSLKTNTKPALSNPLQPSDIKLFVTNLRLLDLHGRPDWPEITVQTFSAKNADQRQRIQAVEWTLFRLFELWDPVETSQVRKSHVACSERDSTDAWCRSSSPSFRPSNRFNRATCASPYTARWTR